MKFARDSRSKTLAILVVAVMALFVVRLFYIQILRHDYYSEQADSEYIKQSVLHANRGEIYLLDGSAPVLTVMNETVYTVWADPTEVTEPDRIVSVLNKVAGGNVRADFKQYLQIKNSRYQILAYKVTRTQMELIKKENIAGLRWTAVNQRVYPEGQLASQTLGFVNADGEGQYGFEQYNNDALKGKDGELKTVTDVRDVPLTIGDKNIKKAAVDGKNTVLTIDRNVQTKVEQTLAAATAGATKKKASAIVMDPNTGKVLAMANVPTYDPSKLSEVSDISLFNNNVISNPYEIGSVAKTFTIATGLDKGVITPETTYVNNGYIKIDDRTINNADTGRLLGTITMQDAVDWSLNTGMVTVAERLGNDGTITYNARQTIYNYFHNKLRLGSVTGIELAGEARGTVISPDNEQGNAVRYSNMTFGQGMDLTMVQSAAAFCSIINGGTYYSPTIISGYMEDGAYKQLSVKPAEVNVISQDASSKVRSMVHHAHYATYKPQDRDGYYIGGKTGTSQTIDPQTGEYRSDKTIATYLGFGGKSADAPAYVIMVSVYGDGNFGGGVDAKPLFNTISNWMIDYLKL